MRNSVFAVVAAIGSLMAAPVLAQQAPATQTSPPANAANPPEVKPVNDPALGSEMVCKTFAPPTGTRLGARHICRTQAEWDNVQTQAREQVQQIQDTGLTGRKPGN